MIKSDEEERLLKQAHRKWKKDIAKFALDVFGSKLRPVQIEFARAVQKNKRVTFKGGVGFGKTHVLAIVVWWSLFCHDRVKVSIFGPNESQLKNGIWNELISLHGRMQEDLAKGWDVQQEEIRRKEKFSDCYAVRRLATKDNVSAISGIHADNNFIFVDEATGVADEVFADALQNHLSSDINPKLVLISNPKYLTGFFYRTWEDPTISHMWTKVHGRMVDNPRVTQEDLDAAEAQYGGKNTREYRINVLGEFPEDDEAGLIPANLIDMAVNNEQAIPSLKRKKFWGVDPAGPGKDRSTIVKRHDNKVTEMPVAFQGMTITQLSYRVRDMFQSLSPQDRQDTTIVVDANGLGRGLYDNLKDWGLPVVGIATQSRPTKGRDHKGNERYAKLRDQLWWQVREWFSTENVSIPKHEDLIRELKAPSYGYNANGSIKVEGKDDIKKRLKASPDFADALCLTFAADDSRFHGKYSWSKPIAPADLRWAE